VARYKTGSYNCLKCGALFDTLVTAEEYDNNVEVQCEVCGGRAERVVGSPMIMTVSYPDGKKRFCQYKEESKMRLAKLKEQDKRRIK